MCAKCTAVHTFKKIKKRTLVEIIKRSNLLECYFCRVFIHGTSEVRLGPYLINILYKGDVHDSFKIFHKLDDFWCRLISVD